MTPTDIVFLDVARAVQGVGAAVMFAVALGAVAAGLLIRSAVKASRVAGELVSEAA